MAGSLASVVDHSPVKSVSAMMRGKVSRTLSMEHVFAALIFAALLFAARVIAAQIIIFHDADSLCMFD